jgi:hypothetical protein
MYIKERLIRIFQHIDKSITHRAIVKGFDESRRKEAESHLSDMLNSGLINRMGTGKRGSPFKYNRSINWPHNTCPMCQQPVESIKKLIEPREPIPYQKRGDTCRPCLRYLSTTQEYVVYARRTVFEKKGVEVLRTKNKEEAQARLKKIEETES